MGAFFVSLPTSLTFGAARMAQFILIRLAFAHVVVQTESHGTAKAKRLGRAKVSVKLST